MSFNSKTILLAKPITVYSDEDYSVKAPPYSSLALLLESIEKFGALVAYGKMGPLSYTEPPFKLKNQVSDQDIYGWKPGTFKSGRDVNVFLLGGKLTEDQQLVYFTLAEASSRENEFSIQKYNPLATDPKIYVMSYKSFFERAHVNLHPVCPHAEFFYSVDVNAIIDGKDTEKKCKEKAQEIFDQYKAQAKGDTSAGAEALQRICSAAKTLTSDGRIRSQHLACAWDGVGDINWKWQH